MTHEASGMDNQLGAHYRIINWGSGAIISYDFPSLNKDAEHSIPFYSRGTQPKFTATNISIH